MNNTTYKQAALKWINEADDRSDFVPPPVEILDDEREPDEFCRHCKRVKEFYPGDGDNGRMSWKCASCGTWNVDL